MVKSLGDLQQKVTSLVAATSSGQENTRLPIGVTPRIKHWLQSRKYRLTAVFGLAALIFILTAATVISNTISRIAENNLIRITERGISNDAFRMLSSALNTSQPLSIEALAESGALPRALPGLVERYSIVKMGLINLDGDIVWSTDRRSIGRQNDPSRHFNEAMQGSIASEFTNDIELESLEGVRPRVAIVETYIPLRDPSTGQVMGVLEINRNVTDDVPLIIEANRSSVLRVTAVTMAALFVVLLTVVVIADVTISRSKQRERATLEAQLVERKQAALTLETNNTKLEEVVAELKETQQHIVKQERLRALGEMASGIAHDFNNALTPILGFTSLMMRDGDGLNDIETIKSRLQIIQTGAEDAAAVVARLKEFYRQQEDTDQFTPTDLNQLVTLVISLSQAKWKDQALAQGATISVRTNLQEVPSVLGEASKIREALINLIINAVDAMPNGGSITFDTYTDGDQVVLSISDTGNGMTEQVKERCLDPFFTTKGSHGTGIGLSMVYGIIQRHGGTMEIESELDKGTSFIFRFPVPKFTVKEDEDVMVQEFPLTSLHVLAVDDESMVAKLVTAFLTKGGHTVVAAANGREGLEKFQEQHFDLVFTDRAMPEMNGDQLAVAIKEISPKTPVIMLTGFGDIMAVTNDKPVGTDLVLSKPFNAEMLRQAMVEVTNFSGENEQPPQETARGTANEIRDDTVTMQTQSVIGATGG